MKFKNGSDKQLFESLKLSEQVIRKKLGLAKLKSKIVTNRKKSSSMKTRWRRDAYKLKKAIQKWHKSTQGKRFHRALGRFNATHESAVVYYYNKNEENQVVFINLDFITNALLNLSSIETHLYIELQYFEEDIEALFEFIELVEMFVSDTTNLKNNLLEAIITGYISFDDYQLLIDILIFFMIDKDYLYAKREKLNLSNDINIAKDLNEDFNNLQNLQDKFERIKYIKRKYESSVSDLGVIPTNLDAIIMSNPLKADIIKVKCYDFITQKEIDCKNITKE